MIQSLAPQGGTVKEDVLEQIVDDYLKLNGYFTIHNLRFKPRRDHSEFVSSQDSVNSDLDVLGINLFFEDPATRDFVMSRTERRFRKLLSEIQIPES
jgi:hypothetical protein